MSPLRILALALIVVGVLGLAYGSFTYLAGTHDLGLGLFDVSVDDRETVYVPVWAGVGAIAGGVALLFLKKPA